MSAESLSTDPGSQQSSAETTAPHISLVKCIAVILLAGAVFLLSQIGVLFGVEVLATIRGLSEAQREDILSDGSYWPKLGVYAAITASMVALTFYAVRTVWFSKADSAPVMQKVKSFLLLQKRTFTATDIVEVLGTYGFYFFTTLVVSVLISALGVIDTSQPQDLGIAEPSTVYELGAVFFMLVILPPIGEEILFRGLLFRGLERYGSVIVSYGVTSLLFGLAHAQIGNEGGVSWNAVLDTMIFSVFLIHITRRHKSLYSAMLLHGLKNAVAFLILFGVNWL